MGYNTVLQCHAEQFSWNSHPLFTALDTFWIQEQRRSPQKAITVPPKDMLCRLQKNMRFPPRDHIERSHDQATARKGRTIQVVTVASRRNTSAGSAQIRKIWLETITG